MTWELMPNEGADVTSNVEGCVTTIQLTRISDTKQTVMRSPSHASSFLFFE